MNELYNKINYLAPIDSIIGQYVNEYDISKANINILLHAGKISKTQYEYFYNLPRMDRQIQLGIMQRDEQIKIALQSGIIEAKRMFFEANNIMEYQILSIKNDAVFLINTPIHINKFDNIEFVMKNSYTSFYKFNKVELYYFNDMASSTEYLHSKGIGEDKLKLHELYFLDFLKVLFEMAQSHPILDTISLLKTFYNNYISLNLDIGYYRTFDSSSMFILKQNKYTFGISGTYKMYNFPDEDKKYIDISYNESILRKLYSVYTNIYFNAKK